MSLAPALVRRALRGARVVSAIMAVVTTGALFASDARAADEISRRAYSEWQETARPALFFAEAVRLIDDDGEFIAGAVGAVVCGERSGDACLGASFIKILPPDAVEIDPTLSSARLEMRRARLLHEATWEADQSPPTIDLSSLPQGEVSASQEADAGGNLYRREFSASQRDSYAVLSEGNAEPGDDPGLGLSRRLPDLPAIAGIRTGGSVTSASRIADSTCYRFRRAERQFTRAINVARSVIGQNKLRLDPELSRAARRHTYEMTSREILYHTSSSLLGKRVTNWVVLGENVGVGMTPATLHDAFMASPPHRENILYPTFEFVGVGTARKAGRLWVTVIFERSKNPGTTLSMPRC